MATLQEAIQLLHDTESRLRGMIAEAAAGGDYTAAAEIATLAGALRGLTANPEAQAPKRAPSASSAPASAANAAPSKPPARTSRAKQAATPARKPAKRGAKADYPRFYREGDRLVKVAWSRKSMAEYEHRAPREVIELLLEKIRARVPDGKKFAATTVIPLASGEASVPDYQAYVALGWLHSEGVITKHGRDRYSVELGRVGPGGIEPYWVRLPVRN